MSCSLQTSLCLSRITFRSQHSRFLKEPMADSTWQTVHPSCVHLEDNVLGTELSMQWHYDNPCCKPNATITDGSRVFYCSVFVLFIFPATYHIRADRLSHHLLLVEDPPEEDDHEDWLYNSYSCLIILLNDCISLPGGSDTHLVHC